MGGLDRSRGRLAQGLDDVREYERITGFSKIARRALANNAFDGVLTMIGVLMGNYLGGVRNAGIVIRIGIATAVSIGVSGLWGAYLAESAERGRELAELERLSLTDLGETKIGDRRIPGGWSFAFLVFAHRAFAPVLRTVDRQHAAELCAFFCHWAG